MSLHENSFSSRPARSLGNPPFFSAFSHVTFFTSAARPPGGACIFSILAVLFFLLFCLISHAIPIVEFAAQFSFFTGKIHLRPLKPAPPDFCLFRAVGRSWTSVMLEPHAKSVRFLSSRPIKFALIAYPPLPIFLFYFPPPSFPWLRSEVVLWVHLRPSLQPLFFSIGLVALFNSTPVLTVLRYWWRGGLLIRCR